MSRSRNTISSDGDDPTADALTRAVLGQFEQAGSKHSRASGITVCCGHDHTSLGVCVGFRRSGGLVNGYVTQSMYT